MENAEKACPGVQIELFGEQKTLITNFGTLVRFEKKSGKNGLSRYSWNVEDLCILVWAALGGEQSGKTVEEVTDQLSGKHSKAIAELTNRLFAQAELTDEQKKDVAA